MISIDAAVADASTAVARKRRGLRIAHLYPELLNLYGDSGNILVLRRRLEWRGLGCEVVECHVDDRPSFSDVDIVFIGGGSDREQKIVCDKLLAEQAELKAYVEDGGVRGAVGGGYQLLGHSYLMGDEEARGLSLVDLYTDRGSPRLIGNIAVESRISPQPVVGYENHGGRTHLGPGVEPMGRVLYGHGNDGTTGEEGCLYKNVVGTYVHGPLLPKNPGVADYLISRALERRYGDGTLEPLDDTAELAANKVMYDRLMAGEVKEYRLVRRRTAPRSQRRLLVRQRTEVQEMPHAQRRAHGAARAEGRVCLAAQPHEVGRGHRGHQTLGRNQQGRARHGG